MPYRANGDRNTPPGSGTVPPSGHNSLNKGGLRRLWLRPASAIADLGGSHAHWKIRTDHRVARRHRFCHGQGAGRPDPSRGAGGGADRHHLQRDLPGHRSDTGDRPAAAAGDAAGHVVLRGGRGGFPGHPATVAPLCAGRQRCRTDRLPVRGRAAATSLARPCRSIGPGPPGDTTTGTSAPARTMAICRFGGHRAAFWPRRPATRRQSPESAGLPAWRSSLERWSAICEQTKIDPHQRSSRIFRLGISPVVM